MHEKKDQSAGLLMLMQQSSVVENSLEEGLVGIQTLVASKAIHWPFQKHGMPLSDTPVVKLKQ